MNYTFTNFSIFRDVPVISSVDEEAIGRDVEKRVSDGKFNKVINEASDRF